MTISYIAKLYENRIVFIISQQNVIFWTFLYNFSENNIILSITRLAVSLYESENTTYNSHALQWRMTFWFKIIIS